MTAKKRIRRILVLGIWASCAAAVVLRPCWLPCRTAAAQQVRSRGPAVQIQARQIARAYQIAQNTTATGDASRGSEPILRAYRCPAGNLAAVGEMLQAEFGRLGNVRIVVDARTSQIVVQAPEGVHAEIANRLNGQLPPASLPAFPQQGVPAQAAAAPEVRPQPLRSRELQLQRSSVAEVEQALARIMGRRLSPVPSAAPGMRNYQLALPGGGVIDVGIHEQSGRVIIQGGELAVNSCVRLIQALDAPRSTADSSTQMVSLQAANPVSVQRAVNAIRAGTAAWPGTTAGGSGRMLAQAAQPQNQQPPAVAPGAQPGVPPEAGAAPQEGGLIGPVQIELLEGLDILVIHGHRRDVEQVLEIIKEIDRISAETVPAVEIYQLSYVNCEALVALISPLYEQVYLPRQGAVNITALVKPNAIMLVGRSEAVQTALDLIKRLDQPVAPESQSRVFRLRHAAAGTAEQTVRDFFAQEQGEEEQRGLAPRVLVVSDFRSNSLIVRGSPGDIAEVAALVERIDTPTSEAVNEIRVFQLTNSLAEDVAGVLNDAIGVQQVARQAAAGPETPRQAGRQQQSEQKSTMLQFLTIDAQGQRRLTSGILTDVRVTADTRANALLVSAPAESMALIEALIQQVDRMPAAEAQIKVFTIVNGDASNLMEMLQQLFAQQATTEQMAVRTGAVEGESSLVQLRFAVDQRTNSIIASGSMGDLQVVEAILLRLDTTDAWERKTMVYRLKNAPAEDVANAINQFLESKREVEQIREEVLSPFEQIDREVIVVPEPVSNSLIVSATERFYKEIQDLVEKLDERPPMVMIQVLIAEVTLNDTDEFGVELGLQDSVLFDRSLIGDLVTLTRTTQTAAGQVAQEELIGASNTPGYAFNNQTPGNSGSDKSLVDSSLVGTQGLSHFAVGRTNNELGFGGLVLSASSESVSILLRALKECRRLDVLSRPQIMTLDNQPAWMQVGQHVPMIRGTTVNEAGQTNRVEFEDVGLILVVQPRISPDNQVVMIIEATKSSVGPEAEGIPISISATGQVIRSPRIDTTNVKTTVSATDGQTMVLGGLITKSKSQVHRKVPCLGDLPLLRYLFRYDSMSFKKTELLIIMTPHIVRNEADAEILRQVEAARMDWCLSDVLELVDDPMLRTRSGEWSDAETNVIYPDVDPGAELIPVPEGQPSGEGTGPDAEGNPFRPEQLPAPEEVPLQPTSAPSAAAPPLVVPGVVVPEPSSVSRNAVMNLRRVDQVYYQVPVCPGGVEPAVYRYSGVPAAQYPRGTGEAVRLGYQAAAQQAAAAGPPYYRQPAAAWPQQQYQYAPGAQVPQTPTMSQR